MKINKYKQKINSLTYFRKKKIKKLKNRNMHFLVVVIFTNRKMRIFRYDK